MPASEDELRGLRESVRDFLAATVPSAVVRATLDTGGFDARAWHEVSGRLGLTAIAIPEQFGGAGYSFGELGVVLEEFGAALAPVPLLPTVVAAAVIAASGDDATRRGLLPAIAAEHAIATVVLDRGLVAAPAADGWTLRGTVRLVPNGAHAGLFVVAAAVTGSGDEPGALYVARADESRVRVRPLAALDATRPLAAVEFVDAPAVRLGVGPDVLDHARSTLLAAIACEQVGAAGRCLELIVDYVKTRVQFGVPIGSFQAIKHRCADLLVELEAARSIAYHARDQLGAGETDLAMALSAASWCAEAYVRIAQESIQLHGGIGFTWEHDAHLHLRRARADQLLYGTPREHRRALAPLMGI